MFCTHCGKQNPEQSRFCFSCGQEIQSSTHVGAASVNIKGPANMGASVFIAHHARTRPGMITLLAILQLISASLALVAAFAGTIVLLASDDSGQEVALLGMLLLGVLGALQLRCGLGLWRLKSYGRTMQLVFAWIGLLAFPIGTVISILILIYLNKPGIKLLFSERPLVDLTADEAAYLSAISQGWSVAVVLLAGIIVLVLVAVVGIVAAIAVPGLLRARMAGNEASAIGTLRAINRAQQTYAGLCNGFAPSVTELTSRASFSALEPSDLPVIKSGYRFTMLPSADATLARNAPPGCSGAVANFFAHAEPLTPGSTGTRYFATNNAGTIFQDSQPFEDPISAGAIPLQ